MKPMRFSHWRGFSRTPSLKVTVSSISRGPVLRESNREERVNFKAILFMMKKTYSGPTMPSRKERSGPSASGEAA